MGKPRELKRWKVIGGDLTVDGLAMGDIITIEGEYVDRWFDPHLRKLYKLGRILKWHFYWKWRL